METVIEVIKGRRSVRSFTRKNVSEEMLRQVLQAGFCAPSANNTRPWHVVVVRDPAIKTKLADTHIYSGFVSAAPVVLVVCGDRKVSPDYWIEDCSVFSQNLLLAARGLGLATCWVSVRQGGSDRYENYVRKVLGLPEDLRVLNLIPLGHPAEEPMPRAAIIPPRRVHYDKYGQRTKG
jgi:nitroreductase